MEARSRIVAALLAVDLLLSLAWHVALPKSRFVVLALLILLIVYPTRTR